MIVLQPKGDYDEASGRISKNDPNEKVKLAAINVLAENLIDAVTIPALEEVALQNTNTEVEQAAVAEGNGSSKQEAEEAAAELALEVKKWG